MKSGERKCTTILILNIFLSKTTKIVSQNTKKKKTNWGTEKDKKEKPKTATFIGENAILSLQRFSFKDYVGWQYSISTVVFFFGVSFSGPKNANGITICLEHFKKTKISWLWFASNCIRKLFVNFDVQTEGLNIILYLDASLIAAVII